MHDNAAVLRVGLSYAPASTDDPHAMDLSTVLVTSPVFETPCELADGDEAVRPVLFAEVPTRKGPLQWRGQLRDDLKLSNGDPLSAAEMAAQLRSAAALTGVRLSVEGNAIVFETRHPEDNFPKRLVSRSTLLAVRRGAVHLGTGPFQMVHGPAEEIALERNPHYRTARESKVPGIRHPERIEFTVHPRDASGEATSLIEALNEQRVDFTMELNRDEVELVQKVRRIFRPGDSTCLLSFNTRGAFADPELRHAAAMAIDRQAIASTCFQNPVAYVARGVLPPQLARMRDDLRFDLEAARARIKGHVPERPLRMLRVWAPRPYMPRPPDVANAVIEQLSKVGLTIEDRPAQGAEDYYEHLVRGDYDMVLGGWIADTGNPAEFMHSVLHSSMIPTPTQAAATACNMARVSDSVLDELVDAYLFDGEEASLKAVQARTDETRPLVPLMYGPCVAVHAWRVRSLEWKDRRLPDLAAVELADA